MLRLPGLRRTGDEIEFASSTRKMHKAKILEVLPMGYKIKRDDGKTQTIRADYDMFAPPE